MSRGDGRVKTTTHERSANAPAALSSKARSRNASGCKARARRPNPRESIAPAPDAIACVRENNRLERLIETCRDGVVFIDTRGIIKVVNQAACEMFGYCAEELENADVCRLMSEPYAQHHHRYVEHYERTGERKAVGRIRRVSARRKSGEEFPIELSVTELAEGVDGIRYAAFIRDVSDKLRLQADLVERERLAAVGTTASMLVHEVGNPLNNMALQLQALRRKLVKQDGVDGALILRVDACTEEISRLSRLVQEFRALSGRRRLSRRTTSVTKLVESALTNYLFRQNGVSVVRAFDEHDIQALIDPDKMVQVILNLCQNAVEAMPRGGTLTVRTRKLGRQCIIEVEDTGHGVPDGLDVFEPFATTKRNGTGLGLAICAEIVRDHGGVLDFDTRTGEGTTFRIELPMEGVVETVATSADVVPSDGALEATPADSPAPDPRPDALRTQPV